MEAAIIEKFWNNVEKTKTCWLWFGSVCHNVPEIKLDGKKHYPRKISLVLDGKDIIPGKQIKPLCKNALCINPDHLVTGDEARFWSKVSMLDDCWPWLGRIDDHGYGSFRIIRNGKRANIRAHIYSWELYIGRHIRKECKLCICHKCDHRWCVNPDHLFIGTYDDNNQDKVAKNRQTQGISFPQSKLTDDKVREARLRHGNGETIANLAIASGVSWATMSLAIKRKTWKHVV